MKIYIGADHGGFKLKEELKGWLKDSGYDFEDLGAFNFVPEDDFVDYAWPLALKVGGDESARGILVCRSGQGECVVANKARGVRAVPAWNEKSAYAGRHDNNANIVCLPADYITPDGARKIIEIFLTTPFGEEERFHRRVDKVRKIDANL
ncbi:MAG: RpiB/LacA/LacB family sugar-phosphate isomerase [Candidatus Doudnabacteria bacterium]|nr:RpiB/LacA/LacB family sugar-phosphate isomerase [Candidatus Doudnabacteria bacterium]